jgi:ABC-type glycerol-3-phosphate transport system permease component
MAAAILTLIPIIVLFFAVQKCFVHGLIFTDLKG